MDELLQEFIAETRETLAALEGEIVAWEIAPDDRARLDAIFRFVHTVKGSCGFLDQPRLARLSHHAEDVLAAVRDGRRTADRELVDAVLAIVDRIGELVEALDGGATLGEDGDETLIAALAPAAAAERRVAPVAATQAVAPAIPARAAQRSVRLPVELLDRMMSGMSDMVLARNDLARRLRDGDDAATAALDRLSLIVGEMRDTVGRTRMQPIEALFSALPRIVRDTAAQLDKQIALVVEGADVEIDRELVEALRDPLVHMIRNAIDHGIESPAARLAAGKPAGGTLRVGARQSGNTIVVEIADDGAGIDVARLVAKHAAATGRSVADFAQLGERARLDLVFEPGLSSRDAVTQMSGRGVGMDVVRANIEQIGGRVELVNAPGRGLAVALHVPMTLSILPTIVIETGGQRFALSRQSVAEIVVVDGRQVRVDTIGNGAIATVRGDRLGLIDLAQLLKLPAVPAAGRETLVIVAVPGGRYALRVATVIDSEELVVKPAAPAIMGSGVFAGQALPDTGEPMLVLDPDGMAAAGGLAFVKQAPAEPVAVPVPARLEALLVHDADNVLRALPLAAVQHLEEVERDAFGWTAGSLRMVLDGTVVPVVSRAALPDQGQVRIVRLQLAGRTLAYVVKETIDVVRLGDDWADAPAGAGLLGIAVYENRPVEIVDPAALLPGAANEAASTERVCVLAGDHREWMAGFLAPVLARAGYRVATDIPPGAADVTMLAMEDDDLACDPPARIVRLSDAPDGPVFRFDRAAVLAAVVGAGR